MSSSRPNFGDLKSRSLFTSVWVATQYLVTEGRFLGVRLLALYEGVSKSFLTESIMK